MPSDGSTGVLGAVYMQYRQEMSICQLISYEECFAKTMLFKPVAARGGRVRELRRGCFAEVAV